MSYAYRVIADKPRALFALDSSVIDMSGNDCPVTLRGQFVSAPPLVVGGGVSMVVNEQNGFSFQSNPTRQYTYEIWVKVTKGSEQNHLIGREGEGLYFDGERIVFITSSVQCEYDIPENDSSFHVVATRSNEMAQLFVDSQLVSAVELTNTATVSNNILVGIGQDCIVDCPALYDYVLSSETVVQHFAWGRTTKDFSDVVVFNNGNLWTFLDEDAQLLYDQVIDWTQGYGSDLAVAESLSPFFELEETVKGTWIYGIALAAISDVINGSKIEWDGDGDFEVRTSIDNESTWQQAINGQQIAGISDNFQSEEKSLSIEVIIPAGLPLETATKINWLRLKFYKDKNPRSTDLRRSITLRDNVSLASNYYQPIEYQNLMGAHLVDGSLLVSQDVETEGNLPVRTVEMWVKFNDLTPGVLFDRGTSSISWNGTSWSVGGASVFVNGSSTTLQPNTFKKDQWYHLVIVLTSNLNSQFSIGANLAGGSRMKMNVGMLCLYADPFLSPNVLGLYNFYIGDTTLKVPSTQTIKVVENKTDGFASKAYSFDWAITAGG